MIAPIFSGSESSLPSSGDRPTRPLVCERTFRTVIGWAGFFRTSRPSSFSATTIWPRNSGRYFSTGSSSRTLPSSTSIISAEAVIGFDIEAIQKRSSGFMGVFGGDVGVADGLDVERPLGRRDEHDGAGELALGDEGLERGGQMGLGGGCRARGQEERRGQEGEPRGACRAHAMNPGDFVSGPDLFTLRP